MSTELTNAVEAALVKGDLATLTAEQRVSYYRRVCDSVGLNPLTRPFDYITLNGKLTLYARKDATDQLRRVHGVSIGKPDITFQDDWIIVTVGATDASGRSDSDVGMVRKSDMQNNLGNAVMKAVTKAKRRVTLSICGLGMLDETEVETIPDAKPEPAQLPEPTSAAPTAQPDQSQEVRMCKLHDAPMTRAYSEKAGKYYWYHTEAGQRCFGHEVKAKQPAQPEPVTAGK